MQNHNRQKEQWLEPQSALSRSAVPAGTSTKTRCLAGHTLSIFVSHKPSTPAKRLHTSVPNYTFYIHRVPPTWFAFLQPSLKDWVWSTSFCKTSPTPCPMMITLPSHLWSEHHLSVIKEQIITFIFSYQVHYFVLLDKIIGHHISIPWVWEKGMAMIKWILWLNLTSQ